MSMGDFKVICLGDDSKFLSTTLENYFPEADPETRLVYRVLLRNQ